MKLTRWWSSCLRAVGHWPLLHRGNLQVRRTAVAASVGLVLLLLVSAPTPAQYRLTNLVSNQIDEHARTPIHCWSTLGD